MSEQKRYDFWESWCRIFGPPAIDFPDHTEPPPRWEDSETAARVLVADPRGVREEAVAA